jgi:hypothetical protein
MSLADDIKVVREYISDGRAAISCLNFDYIRRILDACEEMEKVLNKIGELEFTEDDFNTQEKGILLYPDKPLVGEEFNDSFRCSMRVSAILAAHVNRLLTERLEKLSLVVEKTPSPPDASSSALEAVTPSSKSKLGTAKQRLQKPPGSRKPAK